MRGNLCNKLALRPISVLKWASVTASLLCLIACAGPGIKQSEIKSEDVINFLDRNYDNFIITYSRDNGAPTAIRFDPKNDDATLTGDDWHPVESKTQVHEIIGSLNDASRYYSMFYRGPYLFEIQSAEDRLIGYLYCLLVQLNIRQEGSNYWMGPVTEADLKDERKLFSIKGAGG